MATKNMSRLNVSLTAYTGQFTRKMNKAMRTVKKFAGSINGLLLGYAGFKGVEKATTTIMDFEKALSTIKGVSGATKEEMAALTKQARELGATTEHTATAASNAQLILARANFSVNDSLKVTPHILAMATAAEMSMAEAADLTVAALRQFSLEMEEARRVTDVIVTAANSGTTNVQELGDALKYTGGIASSLGVSIEETAAALSVLADNGLKGSMAGRNLRAIFTRLVKLTPEAKEEISKLGLSLGDVDVQANGLANVFRNLEQAGAGPVEMARIFNAENIAAVIALSKNAQAVDKLRAKNERAQGSTKKLADVMQDNLAGSFKQLKSAFEEIMLAGGEAGLLGMLRKLVDSAVKFVRGLSDMQAPIEMIKKVARAIGFVTDAWQGMSLFYQSFKVGLLELGREFPRTIAVISTGINTLGNRFGAVWEYIKSSANLLWDTLKVGWRTYEMVHFGSMNKLVEYAGVAIRKIGNTLRKMNIAAVRALGLMAYKAGGELILQAQERVGKLTKNLEEAKNEFVEANVSLGKATIELRKAMAEQAVVPEDVSAAFDSEIAIESAKLAAMKREELWSEGLQREIDALSAALDTKAQLEYEKEEEAHQKKLTDEARRQDELNALKKEKTSIWTQAWNAGQEEQKEFTEKHWSAQAQDVASSLKSMTDSVAQENRAMFAINKVASYATAIINTSEGVTKTLAKYPGPLGIAMAAVHAAAGLAQINQISQTSLGGGGGGTAGVSTGAGSVGLDDSANTGVSSSSAERGSPMPSQMIAVRGGDFLTIEQLDEIFADAREGNYMVGGITRV